MNNHSHQPKQPSKRLAVAPFFLKEKIAAFATDQLTFDDCRFTGPLLEDDHLKTMQDWLRHGGQGDMIYLKEHLKFKSDPQSLLPGVKSAIVVIKNYKNTPARQIKYKLKIARYAVGKDYHIVMKERLEALADFIKAEDPSVKCYCGVDSRPIAERSLALKAGIGFRGKNTMVIKPGLGSYFFIGVILTTHAFASDQPLKWDCGQCRLCLDACPTGALTGPFTLKATQCISYMTIEQKAALTPEQLKKTGGWLFGCDVCQEVCPYNHDQTPLTDWIEFQPTSGVGFDFFKNNDPATADDKIPKTTPLYRSRKRIIPNWKLARGVDNK